MEFDKLSKKQRRIAVAKDVLKWLAMGRMTAKKKTYLAASQLTPDGKINGFNCRACALGGMFACVVEQKKGVNLHEFNRGWADEDGGYRDYGSQEQMHDMLGEFFDADELRNIENAFEGRDREGGIVNGAGAFYDEMAFSEDALKFNAGIRSPKKRMQRIMRNIIRNEGRFIP